MDRTVALGVAADVGEALRVAAVANGDVQDAAGVDGVIVDRVAALVAVHVACGGACAYCHVLQTRCRRCMKPCFSAYAHIQRIRHVSVSISLHTGGRTIVEQVHAVLVGKGLEDDAHLLPFLVGRVRAVPCSPHA